MAISDRWDILRVFPWTTGLNTIAATYEFPAASGGPSEVDVVVSLPDPTSLSDNNQIALVYLESETIARGEQDMQDGQTRTLERIIVRPGETLALLTSGITPDRFDVLPVGKGKATEISIEAEKRKADSSFQDSFGRSLGETLGKGATAIGFILVGLVAYAVWRETR